MINIDEIITTDGYLLFCNDNDICYIKTDFFHIGQFIWRGNIHPMRVDDICVIGHSDYTITDNISSRFKKVFCINRDTDSESVFGLPLGITNDCDDSTTHRIYGNKEIMIDVINDKIEKENLAYMNFNINTFSERLYIYELFKDKDWIKMGNIENTIYGRKKYLREIKSSKFVICPRGNGIDTHRMWETLYMGSIPIVKYEKTHHLFTDLPILFINDWSEINEDFLKGKYNEMIYKEWNMEKLKISYWFDFIKSKVNE